MIRSIKLEKQFGRDFNALFRYTNRPVDTTNTNLKKYSILQAQNFIKNLLTVGRSPEDIIGELLLIVYDPFNVVINQNISNQERIDLKLQLTSIQQLAKNESTLFRGMFAKDLPRGFQNLLAYVYIAANPQHAFLPNGKFRFTGFKRWIDTINPNLANKLEASYFTSFSYQRELREYSIGNEEYNAKTIIQEFPTISNHSTSMHQFTPDLLRELTQDKAGYEPFMTNLLDDLENIDPINGCVVIGDLDGDIVRFVLALVATAKVSHITSTGLDALMKLIYINQKYYLGKFNSEAQEEVFKKLQLAQAKENLIHKLTKSLTHTESNIKLIMIGDIFFDRMSNYEALLRLIKDVHEYNPNTLVNIIGDHDAAGLAKKMDQSAIRGSYSYSYFHKTQYRDFLNEHFQFIYYEANKKTVYSHTLFDTSQKDEKKLVYYTDNSIRKPINKLIYLGQEYIISESTDPHRLFNRMNRNLKRDYLINNMPITTDHVDFTMQGQLNNAESWLKFNKVKYLLSKIGIKSVFGHDGFKFISDNLIGVNHYLDTGTEQTGFEIAYHIADEVNEDKNNSLTFMALKNGNISLSGIEKYLYDLITNSHAEEFPAKIVEFFNSSSAREVRIVYLSKLEESAPSIAGQYEFLLMNAQGQELAFTIEINEENIQQIGANVANLLEALKYKTLFEIKLSELYAKQAYLFKKALRLFTQENIQYSIILDGNQLTICNGESVFNFSETMTLSENVDVAAIRNIIK